MKVLFGTLACAGALMLAAPHAAQASPQATTTTASSDRAIDARITRRIAADTSLKKHHVTVSVENGVATLSGTVATDGQRARAESLAAAAGATEVRNQIVVDSNAGMKGTAGTIERKTKEGAAKTKDLVSDGWQKTKDGSETVWEKTKEGASKTGEAVTDAWITTDLKTRITADKTLRAGDIHVDTDHYVVTLTGSVPSAAARVKAAETAREVNGVTRVIDRLRIQP